jgi:hypothetical protein
MKRGHIAIDEIIKWIIYISIAAAAMVSIALAFRKFG